MLQRLEIAILDNRLFQPIVELPGCFESFIGRMKECMHVVERVARAKNEDVLLSEGSKSFSNGGIDFRSQ